MKKFDKIEKRFTEKVNNLGYDMAIALKNFLNDFGAGIQFSNGLLFTMDSNNTIFIETIFADRLSVWVRYRYNKKTFVLDFTNEFTLNEKLKLFQILKNYL